MPLFKWQCTGIQIFVLLHIAHSFVLLTANIEDVKKIARKFVSDSLADKLAQFITDASKYVDRKSIEERDIIENVSEDNDRYSDIKLHERNNEEVTYDILKTNSKEYDDLNSNKKFEDKEVKRNNEKERGALREDREAKKRDPNGNEMREESKSVKRGDYQDKVHDSLNDYNNEYDMKDKKPVKQYSYSVKPNIEPKVEKSEYIKHQMASVDSTVGYSDWILHKDGNFKSVLKSHRNLKPKDPEVRGSKVVSRSHTVLSTRKPKDEFDQYVNLNYPKSEFVATSGPVTLTKWSHNSLWERNDNDNNLWF